MIPLPSIVSAATLLGLFVVEGKQRPQPVVLCSTAGFNRNTQGELISFGHTCNTLATTDLTLAQEIVQGSTCSHLQTLNLSGTKFTGGAEVHTIVASALRWCGQSFTLVLDDTNLGDEGASAVATALAEHPPRTEPPLSYGPTLLLRHC